MLPGRVPIRWLAFLVLVAAGCRSSQAKLVPVEGTLRWNHQPLAQVQVIFVPDEAKDTKGPRSTAVTDDSGHYRLVCDTGQPGAVVGFHKVVIVESGRMTDRADQGQPAAGSRGISKPVIPADYRTAAKTPVEREVKAGSPTIDLDLP